MNQRIPIIMCHGISDQHQYPLPAEHFNHLVSIARELGFESIQYPLLERWMAGQAQIPQRSIMFDFDHPVVSIQNEVHEILTKHSYSGTLFVNTGCIEMAEEDILPKWMRNIPTMTWAELRALIDKGWHIGAHTVTHPNFSDVFKTDPSGDTLDAELDDCNRALKENLDFEAKDFAFTGTSWSSVAEKKVQARYRFGRLWIREPMYEVDGESMRYAELVGVDEPDEADGGPPKAARYITKASHPYRLPSMEIQSPLINKAEDFRAYLEGALD